MIRDAGWYFIRVQRPCSQIGFGLTRDEATYRALARALRYVQRGCNAAELNSVQIKKFPGFHIAKLRMQLCQIQQHTSRDTADERHPVAVPAG
jgi:hypothetical protein